MLDMPFYHPYDAEKEKNESMIKMTPAYSHVFSFWRFFFIFSSVHPEV
jgi:hypothetical protein